MRHALAIAIPLALLVLWLRVEIPRSPGAEPGSAVGRPAPRTLPAAPSGSPPSTEGPEPADLTARVPEPVSPGVTPPGGEVDRDPAALPRGLARREPLGVDPSRWLAPRARLAFFEDAIFDVRMRRLDPRSAGSDGEVWHGQLPDVAGAEVVAARVGPAVSISLMLPDGRSFAISPVAGGHVAEEIRSAELPGCDAAERAAAPPEAAAGDPSGTDALPPVGQGAVDPATTVDVMVLYTSAARSYFGGASGIAARIATLVAATNAAYEASGVTQRLRLAHHADAGIYSESDDLAATLDHLSDPGDRLIDAVHQLRDEHGADQVNLITSPRNPDACGIAWVPTQPRWVPHFHPYAFSVVAALCTGNPRVFAHELAHNQGARHDPVTSAGQGMTQDEIDAVPAPFSFGYIAPENAFHTIMAYGSSCGWCAALNRYSNPSLIVEGIPAGDARSDVRGTLNATYAAAVAWRDQVLPFVPGAPFMLQQN